jgi:hypothetical protein
MKKFFSLLLVGLMFLTTTTFASTTDVEQKSFYDTEMVSFVETSVGSNDVLLSNEIDYSVLDFSVQSYDVGFSYTLPLVTFLNLADSTNFKEPGWRNCNNIIFNYLNSPSAPEISVRDTLRTTFFS